MRTLLRIAASLAMLAALTLPAYTCNGYVAPDGRTVAGIPRGADSAAYSPTKIPHYPMEDLTPGDFWFWGTLALYGWPLGLLLVRRSRRVARHRLMSAIAQALLGVVSADVILQDLDFGDWAVGAYVVMVAEGILVSDAVVDMWLLRCERRRSASTPPIDAAATGI